ncbi:MAG: hypothetical protein SZ59_C0001G0092 [candidate division TM6 bacterium GW2011_GWF2_28_16]|nr:MAG: hypothetical protein SZ59_C0001G0092 [candidate division TM6 bacterium GW2011_GWF2_28_16]
MPTFLVSGDNKKLNNLKNITFIPNNIKYNYAKLLKIAGNACDNKFYILGKRLNFENNYSQDIKYAWELSRLYHTPALAKVYLKTQDKKYLNYLINNINSWIDNNPFLTGVNWINPMEVSIRAINLIYVFNYLKDNKNISDKFWVKLINNLYLHKIYIENNWEIYYKNNNHYLADLLGAFYLNLLFNNKNKIKIYKKLLSEFDKQFLPDGTNYEGSTCYHKLSTQMFLHFYYLCKKINLKLNNKLLIKLKRATKFIKLNKINKKDYLQIGDNDSGKILHGFRLNDYWMLKRVQHDKKENQNSCHPAPVRTERSRSANHKTLFHYKNFGLTIIKNNNYHITYRHPTYNKNQPTGHFHQDELSVTLAYNNSPIIIDPGTYLYTGNIKARNLFRSYKSHSAFNYAQARNSGISSLFTLNKQEQKDTSVIKKNKNKYLIKNYFKNNNIKIIRQLLFDTDKDKIVLIDKVEGFITESQLNFIFHPDIKIKKINNNIFEITDKNNNIFEFKSTLNFCTQKHYYSSAYGKIRKCTKLISSEILTTQNIKTTITKLNTAKA